MRFYTFESAIEWLYAFAPMFGNVGAKAIKPGLANIVRLCQKLENPQNSFASVHVAGTNGKGSSSHTLAAILGQAGYKTGLYTSPHLKCFSERMRINGVPTSQKFVVSFLNQYFEDIQEIKPSFFEITTAMAFAFFAENNVEIAVIETGLGGRLDSTNIIIPQLCLITHISYDHQDILGHELGQIAAEKAGIIKVRVPVVIGQTQPEVAHVFEQKAAEMAAPLYPADQLWNITPKPSSPAFSSLNMDARSSDSQIELPDLRFGLLGHYQYFNVAGILESVRQLNKIRYKLGTEHIYLGFLEVAKLTGLKGRWQILSQNPLTIADVAHNPDAIRQAVLQIHSIDAPIKIIVLGFSGDKPIEQMLALLPQDAYYIFCQANLPRAMPAAQLLDKAAVLGLKSEAIPDANQALKHARELAGTHGLVYVGGSIFVVAELDEI